jgi:hypothetical protein
MQHINTLKILFAAIAVSFIIAMFTEDVYYSTGFYGVAFVALCYSMFITKKLSSEQHTQTIKNQLIVTEFFLALVALLCIWFKMEKTIPTSSTSLAADSPTRFATPSASPVAESPTRFVPSMNNASSNNSFVDSASSSAQAGGTFFNEPPVLYTGMGVPNM